MKISQRLIALSVFSSLGLLSVAALGYWAVTSIQGSLRSLTLHATPLQSKTFELQERTERVLGAMLKLSLAATQNDLESGRSQIATEMRHVERLRHEIRELDNSAVSDFTGFKNAQDRIVQTVAQRLSDETVYRAEAERARLALDEAERAIAATRSAVTGIETETAHGADKAQEASVSLGNNMKLALLALNHLKEAEILVHEVDVVTNRFRLSPLRERLKAQVDSVLRLGSGQTGVDHLKDTKQGMQNISDAFTREGSGLLALRADVLAGKAEAENYAAKRKALLATLNELERSLSAMTDGMEAQIVKQRQSLEAALRLRNEPGGIVAVNDALSLDMKEMTAAIRGLMLAATLQEADRAATHLQQLSERLISNTAKLRAGLLKLGRSNLVRNVDAATAALRSEATSLAQMAKAKRSVLASDVAASEALAGLKTMAARQSELGEQQVKSISQRQSEVIEAVDMRVQSSLVLILAISTLIIGATAVLSGLMIQLVTRRLDTAVKMAEAVSSGRLDYLADTSGHDETARLLRALATMVQTLRGIVGQIQSASTAIESGSQEITHGNQDLSERAHEQALSLQATARSMSTLNHTVRRNTESAQRASALASSTSDVAQRGGHAVSGVVQTMQEIQRSSSKIGEIVGLIEGIAFQTNLLALNAAVEAARAGEQGKGFAVVASEVRMLAKRASEAAREIKGLIDASVGQVSSGVERVSEARRTMDEIVTQVHSVTDLINEISQGSHEQLNAVNDVSAAVTQLDEATERNSSLAEQSLGAARSLCEQAQTLVQSVSVFRTEGGEPLHATEVQAP